MKRAGVLAGTLCMTSTCVATAVPAAAHADTPGTPVIHVADRTAEAGRRVTVTGEAPASAGRSVLLQHRTGPSDWTTLTTGVVDADGTFRFRVAIPRSGALRAAVGLPTDGTATLADAGGTTSNEAAVSVRRGVRVAGRALHVKLGDVTRVRGTVAPGTAGLPVKLQVRDHGRWRTLDRTTTAGGGGYELRDRPGAALSASARVVTGSADGLEAGNHHVGRLNVYRWAHVSWYGPGLYGGHLACGGTLGAGTIGVANKSLPCGAKVTLRHGGRSLRVRVIDRGPYVGGREFDLTAATAQKLGFHGHGSMLVTR